MITQLQKIELEKINQDIYALKRKKRDIDITISKLERKKCDIINKKITKHLRQYEKDDFLI